MLQVLGFLDVIKSYVYRSEHKMDRIGSGSRDQFENFSFEQVYEYVKWELEENCLFTVSN